LRQHVELIARLRRGLLVFALSAVLGGAVLAVPALGASPLKIHNPQRDALTGKPLSCPDPSVIGADRGNWRYFLVCTSDNGLNAFPIWMSEDLVHWYPDGYVFPHGKQPYWAVHSTGGGRDGIFWAPSIYRIENRWVVYFAAQYNPASHALGSVKMAPHTMVLGVGTSNSLAGPWHTKLLHYPAQFNRENARPQEERGGGDIDPGVVRDPRTGRLYIFWAEQREQIWEGALSANGLTMAPNIRVALGVTEPWECDPPSGNCTVEGPEPFYRDGMIYLMYSAASTWDYTYAVGVARSPAALDPAQPFVKLPEPILRTANGFLGPGRTSHPIVGPSGESLVLYHALLHPLKAHLSGARTLMLGTLNWVDGWPLINDGEAR
jgi:beta-xylosidase